MQIHKRIFLQAFWVVAVTSLLMTACASRTIRNSSSTQAQASLVSTRQDTVHRGPERPPNPDSVNYNYRFDKSFSKIDLVTAQSKIENVLEGHGFDNHLLFESPDSVTIRTDFLNIANTIKNFDYHFVMISHLVTVRKTATGVKLALQYAFCEAPFKSKYWNYNKIEFHVQEQIKKWVLKNVKEELWKTMKS